MKYGTIKAGETTTARCAPVFSNDDAERLAKRCNESPWLAEHLAWSEPGELYEGPAMIELPDENEITAIS